MYSMKMPNIIETTMLAPCGINCMVCYKHCYHKKPCDGCLNGDNGKPEHCRKCKIKNCVKEKGLSYCFECFEYPCKQIKSMEKSYNSRYNVSLVKNSNVAKEIGLVEFMKLQQKEYNCSVCGGIISIHDAECSECRTKST